jgi:hypothetical protein
VALEGHNTIRTRARAPTPTPAPACPHPRSRVLLRSARSRAIGNNTLTIPTFLFSQPSFLRLLFQAHRETEAHFIATGMPSQRNNLDIFRFLLTAFYSSLKSKVGLAAAKPQPQRRGGQAAALRINLNVDHFSIVAPPRTLLHALPFFSPSSFHTISLPLSITSA